MPTLTVVQHVQIPSGYRLTVRVPDTDPPVLASIAGETIAETELVEQSVNDPETGEESTITVAQPTGASLHTIEWGADVAPELQRTETRALIEQALMPPTDPESITPPGTEL